MSICSDVYITREEAEKRVKAKLLYDYELIILQAISAMDEYELTNHLNNDGDLYYYNIEGHDPFEDDE